MEFKKEIDTNPEKKINREVIFAQQLNGSDSDYIINFSISLMEACCVNDKVP